MCKKCIRVFVFLSACESDDTIYIPFHDDLENSVEIAIDKTVPDYKMRYV